MYASHACCSRSLSPIPGERAGFAIGRHCGSADLCAPAIREPLGVDRWDLSADGHPTRVGSCGNEIKEDREIRCSRSRGRCETDA